MSLGVLTAPQHHGHVPRGRRQPAAERDPLPPQPSVPRHPPVRVGPPADGSVPFVRRVVAATPRPPGAEVGGAAVAAGAAPRPGVARVLRVGLQQAGRPRLAGRAGAVGSGGPVPARHPPGTRVGGRPPHLAPALLRRGPRRGRHRAVPGRRSLVARAPDSSPSGSPSCSTSRSSSARGSRCSASPPSPRSSSGSLRRAATASSASAAARARPGRWLAWCRRSTGWSGSGSRTPDRRIPTS